MHRDENARAILQTVASLPNLPPQAVTEGALLKRINRRLAATTGEVVRKARGWSMYGSYYAVDECNIMTRRKIDLEDLARELNVIGRNEQVVDERTSVREGVT